MPTLTQEQLDKILALQSLKLPAPPAVTAIHSSEYLSSDEEALEIFVIVPDNTPAEQLAWDKVGPIEQRIRETLANANEDRWPYFTICTERDYAEMQADAPTNGEAHGA